MGDRPGKGAAVRAVRRGRQGAGQRQAAGAARPARAGPAQRRGARRRGRLGLTTCSANLQTLRPAGLVTTRREKTKVIYSLAGPDVAALLCRRCASVAQTHLAETERARLAYLGDDDVEQVPREELLRRAEAGDVVVLDVRPAEEYAAGHIPGAVSIPVDELAARLAELPARRRRRRLLPRRLLRARPRGGPAAARGRAAGAQARRRHARMAAGRPAGRLRRRLPGRPWAPTVEQLLAVLPAPS